VTITCRRGPDHGRADRLDEDLGAEGDPTSRLLGARAAALLVARDTGGGRRLPAVDVVLAEVRERLRLGPAAFRPEVGDSAPVEAGAVLGRFAGRPGSCWPPSGPCSTCSGTCRGWPP
jgi:hypothetical protein